MEDQERAATVEETIDRQIPDREKLEKFNASTESMEAEARRQLRRSLELNVSFYEKLAALNAGSMALAVSVGVALLGRATPHSAFLHSNLSWLILVASFLWFSLICAVGHNALFIKIARLESEKSAEWAKWMGLTNAASMQSIIGSGDSEIAKSLNTVISETFHERIQKTAMNQHRTEQSALRAKLLGYMAVRTFLIAYTLVFGCIIHIWWITR